MSKEQSKRVDHSIKQRRYWLDQLAGSPVAVKLPVDCPGGAPYRSERILLELNDHLRDGLQKACRNNKLAIFVYLLTVFKVVSARLSGQEDILVASLTLARPEYRETGTILFRDRIEGHRTFRQLLDQVKETVTEGYGKQPYPPGSLARWMQMDDISALESVVFAMEGVHRVRDFITELPAKQNDLVCVVNAGDGDISLEFIFNGAKFQRRTIQSTSNAMEMCLRQALDRPDMLTREMELVNDADKQWLLARCDDGTEHPVATLYELFERQAELTPDAPLVLDRSHHSQQSEWMTYGQARRLAGHLAGILKNAGVNKGQVVALMTKDPVATTIGILGILRSGCAWMPVSPDYPLQRILYILKDSHVRHLVIQPDLEREMGNTLIDESERDLVLVPIDCTTAAAKDESTYEPRDCDDPAYIIYTSGTTGRPKGVMVTHREVVPKLMFRKDAYQLGAGDCVAQLFSYVFDGFITSFFTPLLSGSRIVMPGDDAVRDINRVKLLLIQEGVTHFICVPALLSNLLDCADDEELGRMTLRVITLAGDQLPPDLLAAVQLRLPGVEIAHEYGVTEASVVSTIYRHQENDRQIKIGSPVTGTVVYILDREGKLTPPGFPGELYIGGAGLALGYLNRPALTAQRFVVDPFAPGRRMYRSGDCARWLEDGTLSFLGRVDHQLKVRGFRIEPGEIEQALVQHDAVSEAVVVVNGDPHVLCGYWVSSSPDIQLDPVALKEFLAGRIPGYMIPDRLFRLDQLPRTTTGKIDRKALPALDHSRPQLSVDYVAPDTELQETIAAVWRDVLDLERVGIQDNYFDLGGNSNNIVIASAKLEAALGRSVPIMTLFRFPTIATLEARLNDQSREQTNGRETELKNLEQAGEQLAESMNLFGMDE